MDLKKVLKDAKNRGWYLHRTGKHCVYKHKEGGTVTVSKTNSLKRVWMEVKKDFIRQEDINNHNGE